jgi:hypothetical protein
LFTISLLGSLVLALSLFGGLLGRFRVGFVSVPSLLKMLLVLSLLVLLLGSSVLAASVTFVAPVVVALFVSGFRFLVCLPVPWLFCFVLGLFAAVVSGFAVRVLLRLL